MSPELVKRGLHIAQGTIDCATHALNHGVAMNIAGGTHHSFADHGEGFCVFNDIALAAQYLLDENLAERILIVDLDVHQGNGTAKIFETEGKVFTFSMHGAKNYPVRKMKSDLDIPLPDKTGDEQYLKMLQNTLPRLINEFEPDFLFYLSGVDVLHSDKLGRLSLSIQGCKNRDEYVIQQCFRNKIPLAISMGGGYAIRIADIIEAHANTFRTAQNIFF